jgi:thiamine kinase-like enzyme
MAFKVDESDDWCFDTKGNRITAFVRGGKDTYQEVGISYWTEEDGKKLEQDVKTVLDMPGGKELLWENVPLGKCIRNYNVSINECHKDDIIEIDTFNELCALDPSYINYEKPKIDIEKATLKNICTYLKCREEDIQGIEFMKIGLTNVSFKFSVNGKNYVYRKPGANTKKFITRKSEVYSEEVAKKLGLDQTVIHVDESGWKLSRYLENGTHINPYDPEDQKASMRFVRKLHDANIVSDYDFDYIRETERFIELFRKEETVDFSEYEDLHQEMVLLDQNLKQKNYRQVLCHNDFWFWNILKDDKGNLCLIDWEYSGNSYPAADVAYFVSSLSVTNADYLHLAELYEGHELSREEKWYYNSVLALVMWYWYVWALYKEDAGTVIEDKGMWYEKAVEGLSKVREYESEGL